MASVGIQPIIGCALALDFADQDNPRTGIASYPRIVLLATREDGYRNLMRLTSRAFLETPSSEKPHIKLAWLDGVTDGLIALTGGRSGPSEAGCAAGQAELAAARCETLLRRSDDRLYMELQRHGTAVERTAEPALIGLAYGKGIPLVATNEPFFARGEDYEA